MNDCRLFISQEALDAWITEGRAEIVGDELRERGTGRVYRLREGVRFLAEVSGASDEAALVGKVKDLDQLAELKAEHMAGSVIMGDNAYEVQSGFVGAVVLRTAEVVQAAPHRQTIMALQSFFLSHVK